MHSDTRFATALPPPSHASQEALHGTIWECIARVFCTGQTGSRRCSLTSTFVLIGSGLFAPGPICCTVDHVRYTFSCPFLNRRCTCCTDRDEAKRINADLKPNPTRVELMEIGDVQTNAIRHQTSGCEAMHNLTPVRLPTNTIQNLVADLSLAAKSV